MLKMQVIEMYQTNQKMPVIEPYHTSNRDSLITYSLITLSLYLQVVEPYYWSVCCLHTQNAIVCVHHE
jgi:hypothetical protein